MTTMVTSQPYYASRRQHAFSSSRNLLNLDCSADLRSYRRDLGPGVQAKCFEKTSDTIRAQLDDHRTFLLRHRQSGQASGFPSPVPRLEVPPSHALPSNKVVPPQSTIPNSSNYHVASHPRPLQILSQPHTPQPTTSVSRPQQPVPGHISTYPVGLQEALERCNHYGHRYDDEVVYEVIVETVSYYLTSEKETASHVIGSEVIDAYESLYHANMKAASIFLFKGYYTAAADEPIYNTRNDGGVQCSVQTESSRTRRTEVYVRKASSRSKKVLKSVNERVR